MSLIVCLFVRTYSYNFFNNAPISINDSALEWSWPGDGFS